MGISKYAQILANDIFKYAPLIKNRNEMIPLVSLVQPANTQTGSITFSYKLWNLINNDNDIDNIVEFSETFTSVLRDEYQQFHYDMWTRLSMSERFEVLSASARVHLAGGYYSLTPPEINQILFDVRE